MAGYEELGELEVLRNQKEVMKRRTRDAFDDAIVDLLNRFDMSFETTRLNNTDLIVSGTDEGEHRRTERRGIWN